MMFNTAQKRPKPLVLLVLDGLGVAPHNKGNAVTLAKTPNLNGFWGKSVHCYLNAAGSSVGLPSGVQGNSEVGHICLGSGKVIFQEIARIDYEIKHGVFWENEVFKAAVKHVKKNKGTLHLMGLVSPGKVHSSMDHLFACLDFCARNGLEGDQVAIHAFTDGRDVSPKSAEKYLALVDENCEKFKVGKIASLVGRYFAMDRDERWERTRMAYKMITEGKGTAVKNWKEALDKSYAANETDEFLKPHVVVNDSGDPVATVKPGDSIIFFNYRADRAVQMAKAFDYTKPIKTWPRYQIDNLYFAGFSNYEKGMNMNRAQEDWQIGGGESGMVSELFKAELAKTDGFPANQIFPVEKVKNSLGKIIADAGMSQLRLTESEKFPHVTYFFNIREKNPFEREDRIEIPSPKDVATYDLKPEMSSFEITETFFKQLDRNVYDFILINFASTDMVAHTGKLAPSIAAVEAVDKCIGKIVEETTRRGGSVIITSDHGNAEELLNLHTGSIDTEHSTNPVPFVYLSSETVARDVPMGILADVAPTALSVMGLPLPEGMVGRNLLAG